MEEKPLSPWKLTQGRIVILVMGVLLILIVLSALMGSLTNYQQLREAAATPPAPAEQPRQ